MSRMIAIGTVHGRKTIRARDTRNPKDRGQYEEVVVKPGLEFDTEDLGISDAESEQLVASGVMKRKTRQVDDDSDGAKPDSRAAAVKKPEQK